MPWKITIDLIIVEQRNLERNFWVFFLKIQITSRNSVSRLQNGQLYIGSQSLAWRKNFKWHTVHKYDSKKLNAELLDSIVLLDDIFYCNETTLNRHLWIIELNWNTLYVDWIGLVQIIWTILGSMYHVDETCHHALCERDFNDTDNFVFKHSENCLNSCINNIFAIYI